MAGQVVHHLLLRGLTIVAREFVRPTNGLIIITRIANETFPPITSLIILILTLINSTYFRCPEDPSLANRTSIPVSLGSYDSTRNDYFGPVKPGLSIHTSISYVPILFLIGILAPVESRMCGSALLNLTS